MDDNNKNFSNSNNINEQEELKNKKIEELNEDKKEKFTGFCEEKSHMCELEYFCKTHNKLCCVACISKLTNEYNGHHNNCDFCNIKNIEEEKKDIIKQNLINLNNLSKKYDKSTYNLKNQSEIFNNMKEKIILTIKNVFNKLKEEVNNREKELLLELDQIFNSLNLTKDSFNKGNKLFDKIEKTIEFGKQIEKEWNGNKLNFFINESLIFENMIKEIKNINNYINKNNLNKINIRFKPDVNSMNEIINTIKTFGKVYNDMGITFRTYPYNNQFIISGESGNIITKIRPNRWIGTFSEESLDTSMEEHIFNVEILKSSSNYFYFGISNEFDIPSSTWIPSELKGWFYHFGVGGLYCGAPHYYHNYHSKHNSVSVNNYKDIKVVMDMKNKILKFIINNEERERYENIPLDKPLFPSVYLLDLNDSLKISYY